MPGGSGKKHRLDEGEAPQWADIRGLLHMRLKDAADELNVPITYIRKLCRENGFPAWPGKKIRYMRSTGKNFLLEGSPWAGLAYYQLGKQPAKELKTLNLIDKVGSSSSSGERN